MGCVFLESAWPRALSGVCGSTREVCGSCCVPCSCSSLCTRPHCSVISLHASEAKWFCPDNVVILWRQTPSAHLTERCLVSAAAYSMRLFVCVYQENKDQQWKRAMDYLSAISELNYMTQIVIMLYEDNNKVRDIGIG